MYIRLLAVSLAGCLLSAAPVRADYSFEFSSGGTFGTSFSVGQGQTIAVQVYLAGNNSTGNTNLSSSGNGLTDGGVSLQFATSGAFNIPGLTGTNTNSNISPNTAQFSGPNSTALANNGNGPYGAGATSTATVRVHSDLPVYSTSTDSSGNNVILLGTFTFTGQSVGTGTTVTAIPSGTSVNVDGMGNDLDSLISGNSSATISVTAVPEPGTMVLGGLLASGILGGYLRRRRGAVVA